MTDKQRIPLAFMSYVRSDDKHENGRLTEFRNRLSGEVSMQTGEGFPIFQDRNDIEWGQNWKERIVNSIDGVTFLIPIITPTFFKSEACRDELKLFLEREKKLKRNDLILPVYYVSSPVLDEDAKRENDELAQEIAKRQYADWRELRFEPFTSPDVGKTLARFAKQIRDALEREQLPQKTAAKRKSSKKRVQSSKTKASTVRQSASDQASSSAQATEPGESGVKTQGSSSRNEPPTIIVDPMHREGFPTIKEAIAAAKAGSRILVRPGLYQEGFVIDKPLEIIGDGEPGEIVIQATGESAVLFKTTMGRISNLTLRQMEGGEWVCVNIAQGRLELEGCDITSKSLSCVVIHDGADPRLRRNRIHDGKESGVFVYENGQGTLEDNDIFGNALAGIQIKTGSNPTVRRNHIHDGKSAGVYIYENGLGVLEDNDIFGNANSGIAIQEDGSPTLRHNRINKNARYAVSVLKAGAGTIEDNDLRDNGNGAFYISDDSKSKVKHARNQE